MNYFQLFTYKNLYLSYLKARKNKRHKKEVINFELNLSVHINSLLKRLLNKTYCIKQYNRFIIFEPKKRQVDAISFEDRVVQHCLVDFFLMPTLERFLIYDNCACRINKGTDFARNRLKYFLLKYYRHNKNNNGYFLKIDIYHYFESIDHKILKEQLFKIISDRDVLDLCFKIIDSFNVDNNDKGLPLGNQTSQCFALLYLNNIDHMIKEKYKIKYYVRYMDDLILIHYEREYLFNVLKSLKFELNSINLDFNIKKTFIKRIKDSIPFLGFNFSISNLGKYKIKVLNNKYHNFQRYIKSLDIVDKDKALNGYNRYLKMRERL